MRFSLRTFLVATLVAGACCGWFGLQYAKRQKELRILADLETAIVSSHVVRVENRDLYEHYTQDRLFKIATHYAALAESESPDSTEARIARAALVHLGSRYDNTLDAFIDAPRAIALSEQYFDKAISPLSSAATRILMRHHRLNEDVHSSQYCRAAVADGFDLDNPIDVYVLVTEVYSDFYYSDQDKLLIDNWPSPRHPWGWDLDESARHSYQDKIDALQQVSPRCARAYAAIVEILIECNGLPSDAQRQRTSQHSNEVLAALPEEAIFRFMLQHIEEFKSHPKLVTASE